MLKTIAKNILIFAVKPELDRLTIGLTDTLLKVDTALSKVNQVFEKVKELQHSLSMALAIDVGLKEAGKVIVLSRVQDIDRVKIIDIKPDLSIYEYQQLLQILEKEYGVKATWIATPSSIQSKALK